MPCSVQKLQQGPSDPTDPLPRGDWGPGDASERHMEAAAGQ